MSSKIRQFIEAVRSVNMIVDKINTDSGELNTDLLDGHSAEYFAPQANTYTKIETDQALELKGSKALTLAAL